MMRLLVRRSVTWWGIVVFVFFFSLILLVYTASSAFSTPDDPYYHVRHALSYARGERMKLPAFSTLQQSDMDLYVWYHRALSPLTRVFGSDHAAAIMGSKIFHAFGSALFFTVFFFALTCYFAEASDVRVRRAKIACALVGTVALCVLSPKFFFRMLLLRPHVFSATLMLLAFLALERRRLSLFLALAVLLPLFYSAAFLLILPVGLCMVSDALYHRSVFTRPSFFAPLIAFVVGTSIGVLLRGNSLAYLYNGSVLTLVAIFDRFRGSGVPQGGELYASVPFPSEVILLASFSCCLAYIGVCVAHTHRTRRWHEEVTFREFYFLLSSLVLVAITFFVSRAAEYAFPIVVLTLGWFMAERAPHVVQQIKGYLGSHPGALMQPLAGASLVLFETLEGNHRFIVRCAGALLICFMAATAFTAYFISASRSGDELRYRGAALAMAAHSTPGALVFNPDFSEYPRLVYWNTHNDYTTGMGPTFTYFFDRSLYWFLYHAEAGESLCPRPTCSEGDADIRGPYDVLAHDIGATFAFVDTAVPSFRRQYLRMLERDPRFELFYEDPEFEEVKVFRVLQ